MFNKVVSSVALSPSNIGLLANYENGLRKRQRLQAVAAVLACVLLLINGLVFAFPPKGVSPSNTNELIRGGIGHPQELLAAYDGNIAQTQEILSYLGISRQNLANLAPTNQPVEGGLVVGRTLLLGSEAGEQAYIGPSFSFALQPVNTILSPTAGNEGWTGSSDRGQFTVIQAGGYVILDANYDLPAASMPLQVEVTLSDASQDGNRALSAGSRLEYLFEFTNTSADAISTGITYPIGDLLEYATVLNGSAFVFDEENATVFWQGINLLPGERTSRTIVAELTSPISSTPRSISNNLANNCRINVAGTTTSASTPVACPLYKYLEPQTSSTYALPVLITNAALTLVVTLLYVRTRTIRKDLRNIRHNLNKGAL